MPGNLNHRFEKNIELPEAAIPAYTRRIELLAWGFVGEFILNAILFGVIAISSSKGRALNPVLFGVTFVFVYVGIALYATMFILLLRIRWADRVRVGLGCRNRVAQAVSFMFCYRPPFVGIDGLTRHQMDEFMVKVRKMNRSSMQTGRISELENAYAEFTKAHAG